MEISCPGRNHGLLWDHADLALCRDAPKVRSRAEIAYIAREDQTVLYTIGLGGLPRLTENYTGAYVAPGSWTAPDTLKIEVEIIGYTAFDNREFRFGPQILSVITRPSSWWHGSTRRF